MVWDAATRISTGWDVGAPQQLPATMGIPEASGSIAPSYWVRRRREQERASAELNVPEQARERDAWAS